MVRAWKKLCSVGMSGVEGAGVDEEVPHDIGISLLVHGAALG